jgi:hypothetical protein
MVHAGVPLNNQWARWPGTTYALPTQCWVGPHHSAVITGIARTGTEALIALAGGKTPRGRTSMPCDSAQVQEAVGRADAILNAGRVYRGAMTGQSGPRQGSAFAPTQVVQLQAAEAYRCLATG